MPRLSATERERAIGMLLAGQSPDDVAAHFGVHRTTIFRLKNRVATTGSTKDRQRPGRPYVLDDRTKRQVVRTFRNNPFQTAAALARQTIGRGNRPVSAMTIGRFLKRQRIRCRRPYRGPILTPVHRQARLNWATIYRRWAGVQWSDVLFSDECRICVDPIDHRIRVYRENGNRYDPRFMLHQNFWGGPSIMMWGGLCGNQLIGPVFFRLAPGRGGGVNAACYINQVLAPHVVPYFARRRPRLFQQDNARAHTAAATANFLQANNIPTMDWPSMSPDLNPTEQLWAYLKTKINRSPQRPATAGQLMQAIQHHWNRIPPAFLDRLVASMRVRCRLVINNAGGKTPY